MGAVLVRGRYAYVVLAALSLVVGGFAILYSVHYANTAKASLQAQARQEQLAQQRQGAALEAKLCGTFGKLAALRPPPGSPAGNPSRSYLQLQHEVLAEVPADISCPGSHR